MYQSGVSSIDHPSPYGCAAKINCATSIVRKLFNELDISLESMSFTVCSFNSNGVTYIIKLENSREI